MKLIYRNFLLASAATACLVSQASAQTSPAENQGGLQEIIVTAQKRSENLQSVPISVAAVSANQMKAAGVVSTQALSNSVAGLTINSTSSFFSPHLRGVGTSFFGPAIENPIGLYVDGIYYGSQLMAPTNLSNLEQVAVLKGPQGTLFGRNSTGGVIQMTTREPKDELGGEFSTELDQYLTSRNFAYLTGAVSSGLKTNIALAYTTQGEGWGKNLTTGNDIHKIYHDFAVRNKWELDAGDFTAKLNLDYADRKDSLGQNLRPPVGYTQVAGGIGNTIVNENPYDSAVNVDNRNKYKGGGVGLNLEYDMGFAKLVSITGYRKFTFDTASDTDASTDLLDQLSFRQKGKQFTQEVQILSPDNDKFNWVVGAYYYWNKDHLGPFMQDFFYFAPGLQSTFLSNLDLKAESIAFFAQATAEILPDTHLTGGFRWTHEHRTMSGSVLENDVFGGISSGYYDCGAPFCGTVAAPALNESEPTWRVALDHKFTPDVLAYASYNRGYKSGGFNGLQPLPTNPYKKEKVDAYEIGMKMELLDRTLRLNPAVFYNRYSDLQVLNLNSVFAVVGNAKKARMYGIDLDGEWQPMDDLSFSFGAEWLNAKFTDFPDMPYLDALPGGGFVDNSAAVPLNGKGNYLPFAPKFAFNIGANYTLHVRDAKFVFNVTDSYNSGYYHDPSNRWFKQKSFNLLNASITWTAPDNRLSVGAFGRNLLDKAVPAQVSVLPVPSGGGVTADYSNPPRTYGVTVGYKFGSVK